MESPSRMPGITTAFECGKRHLLWEVKRTLNLCAVALSAATLNRTINFIFIMEVVLGAVLSIRLGASYRKQGCRPFADPGC